MSVYRKFLRAFAANRQGNVAIIYALALLPVTLAASAGIDYARALTVRASMAEALDAAALAVGGSTNLSQAEMQTLAQQYFTANYHENTSLGTPAALQMTTSGQSIVLSTSVSMPTTFLKLAGISTMDVPVSTKVVWGQLKLWVSLVLDTTGSMSQTDSTGLSKISAMKTASHQLLAMLQNASSTPGDVKVAVVPFVKDVNVGKSNYTQWWIDWSTWDANNGTCSISSIHNQSICITTHGTWSSYKYPRCTISSYTTKTSCENAVAIWTPANHNTWNGCIMDRGLSSGPSNDYDVTNATPVSGTAASLFPADQYSACTESWPTYTPTLAPVMALNYDWTSLNSKIDALVANGSTNQTIGLVWGFHALTDSAPLASGTLPDGTARYIIILSDGFNTQDRWYGDGYVHSSQVDNRMLAVCSNAKAAGIVVFAVLVDIDGTQSNASVLQQCASDPSKYFDLTSSSAITTAFNTIGQQITNLHIAQ